MLALFLTVSFTSFGQYLNQPSQTDIKDIGILLMQCATISNVVLETNISAECRISVQSELVGLCHKAQKKVEINKQVLITKFGKDQETIIESLLNNYLQIAEMAQVNPDQYFSANMWVKAAREKTERLFMK
ncbi:MAG: hypothetical protein JWO03_2522 [Bacteroidetes bacterium]|nr:hypothetical protein [Bacteroidota bacterium]